MASNPRKATAVQLDAKATRAELARAAFASAFRQMRENASGARKDRDPEYVHELRVGARRARVVLRLFEKQIGRDRVNALAKGLRWLFRLLGELRDLEMLLHGVVEPLAVDEQDPALASFALELARARGRAARKVKRGLKSKRYTHLMLALRELQHDLEQLDDAKRARRWCVKQLDKRLAAVLDKREIALGPDDVQRHALRKELKKLRYSCDLMRSLWKKKKAKAYIEAMKELQDVLGDLNDVTAGRSLLPTIAARAENDHSAAIAIVERALDTRLSEPAGKLAPAFDGFAKTEPFWS